MGFHFQLNFGMDFHSRRKFGRNFYSRRNIEMIFQIFCKFPYSTNLNCSYFKNSLISWTTSNSNDNSSAVEILKLGAGTLQTYNLNGWSPCTIYLYIYVLYILYICTSINSLTFNESSQNIMEYQEQSAPTFLVSSVHSSTGLGRSALHRDVPDEKSLNNFGYRNAIAKKTGLFSMFFKIYYDKDRRMCLRHSKGKDRKPCPLNQGLLYT